MHANDWIVKLFILLKSKISLDNDVIICNLLVGIFTASNLKIQKIFTANKIAIAGN